MGSAVWGGARIEAGRNGRAARRMTTKPSDVQETTASSSICLWAVDWGLERRPPLLLLAIGTEELDELTVAEASEVVPVALTPMFPEDEEFPDSPLST